MDAGAELPWRLIAAAPQGLEESLRPTCMAKVGTYPTPRHLLDKGGKTQQHPSIGRYGLFSLSLFSPRCYAPSPCTRYR